MAYTMATLMSGVMNRPDVLIVGLAAGFLLSKAMNMRRRRSPFGR